MNIQPHKYPTFLVLTTEHSQLAPVSHNMNTPNTEDFFRYTSGRWLWNETARLEERYKRFNIAELKRVAVEAAGAQSCSQMIKLAEGGFNKIFKLVMDDNSTVIARIPNPNVGRADRVTASEVATMEFVRALVLSYEKTALTINRQGKSSIFRSRKYYPRVETIPTPSSPPTFSWSMLKAHSLVTCGKT